MGSIFKVPAFAVYGIGALWGLWICVSLVYQLGGILLAAITLVLAPGLLYLAPWYAALFKGDWFPVILIYGTTILSCVLYFIGEVIDGRRT